MQLVPFSFLDVLCFRMVGLPNSFAPTHMLNHQSYQVLGMGMDQNQTVHSLQLIEQLQVRPTVLANNVFHLDYSLYETYFDAAKVETDDDKFLFDQ